MICCHQNEHQVLARFFSFGGLFALKQVSYEGPLVCRKTFTAKGIEERVTVFDENWAEYFGRVCDCNFAGMLLGTVAAPVIEQHSRKRTRPRWLPEECF